MLITTLQVEWALVRTPHAQAGTRPLLLEVSFLAIGSDRSLAEAVGYSLGSVVTF
jgi:hypothetical protein